MNELDWQALSARHDADPATDSEDWQLALDAFDADPLEQRRAIDADPLLMFRNLPAPSAATVDLEAMKRDVAHLRRTAAVTRSSSPSDGASSDWSSRGDKARRWLPLAAALILASGAGYLSLPSSVDAPGQMPTVAASAAASTSTSVPTYSNLPTMRAADAPATIRPALDFPAPSGPMLGLDAASSAALAGMPLVESLDPDAGSLVQIENADLSLVVVLPSSHGV